MQVIKSIIIDDDPFIQNLLVDTIEADLPNVEVLDIAQSGSAGISLIKSLQPDLIFLDVELDDMTGFELLDKLESESPQTIFITSHNHYAIKALRKDALDYLVKPIDSQELQEAIQKYSVKAKKRIRDKNIRQTLNDLEKLVLNILPLEIAREIHKNGTAKTSKKFEMVSVLFADIKDFSSHSKILEPEALVEELHHCYSAFDLILAGFGVEKIKTIGDAYMAAGGVPSPNRSNPKDTVKAGLAIQQFMSQYRAQRIASGRKPFEIRVGIHTGPVVAGIVGLKKFAYDIWGDTVNIAARMEKSGTVGKVNISQSTYEWIKEEAFSFTHRGKIMTKGTGELDMYFVD